MEHVRIEANKYWKTLEERASTSNISRPFQLVGLNIAGLLGDIRHKALYIKYAKEYDREQLLELAKQIAERPGIKNRGAYFMKIVQLLPKRANRPNTV